MISDMSVIESNYKSMGIIVLFVQVAKVYHWQKCTARASIAARVHFHAGIVKGASVASLGVVATRPAWTFSWISASLCTPPVCMLLHLACLCIWQLYNEIHANMLACWYGLYCAAAMYTWHPACHVHRL